MTMHAKAAALAAMAAAGLGHIPLADPDSLLVDGPRGPYRGSRSGKRRRGLDARARAKAKSLALNGNPPGYRYSHRDRLVRLAGARRANELERRVLAGEILYAEAVALAKGSTP